MLSVTIALALVGVLLAASGYLFRGPAVFEVPSHEPRPVSIDRLRADVQTLCTDLAPRYYMPPEQLDRSAAWIAGQFRDAGLPVTFQSYETMEGTYRNVVATVMGSDPVTIVLGAHYDVYGTFPGADDNASGVAVLLEIARTIPSSRPRQTIVFVAFANEEPPFFSTEDMGSHHFAKHLVDTGIRVDLMVSLESLGFYSEQPGSQKFPAPWLGMFYPGAGNFIGIVGDLGSSGPIRRVKRALLAGGGIEVRSFRGPRFVPGVGLSDQYWFWEYGMPAVMVTDTAMLRTPHYHRPSDTPETLDYEKMAAVAQGFHALLADQWED